MILPNEALQPRKRGFVKRGQSLLSLAVAPSGEAEGGPAGALLPWFGPSMNAKIAAEPFR